MVGVLYKTLVHSERNEIESSKELYQEYYDNLFKRENEKVKKSYEHSSEAILRRIIKCINFLKAAVQKETTYAMEKVHLDWINDILANVLYILEPADFIKRASLASKFGITNYNKWAFAFWPRRTGKSFINGIIFMSVLMSLPSGSMAVQSVGMKSALETILPFRSHIKTLFKMFKIEDVEPIRAFSINGIKFINFYGAQLLKDGLHSVSDLPDECFSTVQILSGDEDAGRGITKHIYLMDESEFMKEGAKRNTMMNSKRNGTIVVGISSEDPKQKNPRLEKMLQVAHLATVSIYRNICAVCALANKTTCAHRSEMAWIGGTKDLNQVMDALIENQMINLLERVGGSLLSSGNMFKLAPNDEIEDYIFDEPLTPIKYLFCVIDPALSRNSGASAFASGIFGIPEFFESIDDQKFNVVYTYDMLYQQQGDIKERCNKVIEQIFAFRQRCPQFESMPIIFIPEKNQGDLPISLKTQLLNYSPYLCNWYIYAEMKPLSDRTQGGFCSTDDTKFLGASTLKTLLEKKLFKFHKTMLVPIIVRILEEIQNAQQKVNPIGKSAVPEIYPSLGTHNDGLMCILMLLVGAFRFIIDKNVQHYTLNNYFMKCVDCDKHATGHYELVRKRKYGE